MPAGAPSSYVAGTTYAVDLSSWSYSTATDPRDTTVDVTIGGRAAGTFAVDNTLVDDAYDAHGAVAVRATIPVDLPAGATTVVVTGTSTGTTVRLPIVVTAAPSPEPTPTPTPTPTPVPTPTPTPTPVPAPTRADATVKVKVKPGRVVAGKTRARLKVTVASSGATPTGKVRVKVGARSFKGVLRDGRLVLRLPVFKKAGKVKVTVAYAGDAATLAEKKTVKIRVRPRTA